MNITHNGYTINLTEMDLSIWMASLRNSVRDASSIFPPDSCPFYTQHKELVRLTGVHRTAQEDLDTIIKTRTEATYPKKEEQSK